MYNWQVDLEVEHHVTGILLKGDNVDTEFVTAFTLEYSTKSIVWLAVEEGGNTKVTADQLITTYIYAPFASTFSSIVIQCYSLQFRFSIKYAITCIEYIYLLPVSVSDVRCFLEALSQQPPTTVL